MIAPNSLIMVAPDCPVNRGIVPKAKVKESIPLIQYKVLVEAPYKYNEEEFHNEVHKVRRGRLDLKTTSYNLKRSRLAKEFGWGFHIDGNGKIALVGCETEEYTRLAQTLNTVNAFRTKSIRLKPSL